MEQIMSIAPTPHPQLVTRSSRSKSLQPPSAALPTADGLTVAVVTSLAGARALTAEWAALHGRSGTHNPFIHPSWALTWAEHFVGEDELFIITTRRGGILVGVAPFYWVRLGSRRRSVFRALHLLGNGRCAQFTEIPGVLADQSEHRIVFRETIAFLQREAPSWDWAKLTIDAQQGWFEPQWVTKGLDERSAFNVQHGTRANVVLDLPASWGEFLAARKKNVRESIRRSINRLDKRVGEWSVDLETGAADISKALAKIIDLHRARSEMNGKPNHPTMFGQRSAEPFYREAVTAMISSGHSEISVLRCKGEIVAGLVILRSNTQVYTSVTGADPKAWQLGPGTIMITELARREINRGTSSVNLSAGPNQSKLRWSERLEFNHDFVIVGAGTMARARFGAYSQTSNLAALYRAARWDTLSPGEG
jgi:CelD/BcsL family acetyltransferase involved in cellulose biosynthesis